MRDGDDSRQLRAEQMLAGRLMASTGLDGYAATAVVRDVLDWQGDSPHAELVGPVIEELLAELAKPFTDLIAALAPAVEAIAQALADAVTVIVNQTVPALAAVAQVAHDHDKATHPRRHRRNCAACR